MNITYIIAIDGTVSCNSRNKSELSYRSYSDNSDIFSMLYDDADREMKVILVNLKTIENIYRFSRHLVKQLQRNQYVKYGRMFNRKNLCLLVTNVYI